MQPAIKKKIEKTEPCLAEACLRMFHLRFGLSDHLKALLDFVFGSRRRVKKVRIFRAWFSHGSGAVPALETFGRKPFSSLRSEKFVLRRFVCA